MNLPRDSRAFSRLLSAALMAVPVLALTSACGGDDGRGETEAIASVPGTPSVTGPSGSASPRRSGTGDKGAFYDAQLTYVQCMRGKGGVKEFPDPKLSGHLDWTAIDELAQKSGTHPVKGGGKEHDVCGSERTAAMMLEPKRDAQKDYESMLAHAKCMRDNGVSAFTNPTMSGGNVMPGGDPSPASPRIDVRSPAYKQARQACEDRLLDGLEGRQ
ncbi:hypothetical protein EAO71_16550 [Streptomyces sp. ms191]|uniref:hypothetical protein n=1 Tax=Streptomyces sp. ms191 TaxID=1827978 RepID=UPI0011CD3719|nr:hypothetical protein [Streptomyces sp. ms191]TXS30138.1 hypothetical protein EAO71_16550 [Streptomyces sp. ms191]